MRYFWRRVFLAVMQPVFCRLGHHAWLGDKPTGRSRNTHNLFGRICAHCDADQAWMQDHWEYVA